jgi:dipeptidyl aminopeptidase/acylaminoacyl peptidase
VLARVRQLGPRLVAFAACLAVAGCAGSEAEQKLGPELVVQAGYDDDTEIVALTLTGLRTQLTDNAVADSAPDASPDGARIVFMRAGADPERHELWLMRRDGTGKRRLTFGHDDRDPRWSADGRRVFFSRETDTGGADLMAVPAAGGLVERIIKAGPLETSCAVRPTQSPKDESIVLEMWPGCAEATGDVRVVRKGEEPATLACQTGQAPAFSSDGALAIGELDGTLLVTDAECSTDRAIPTDSELYAAEVEGFAVDPDWSPNGDWIALQAGSGIWIVRGDGTDLQLVPESLGVFDPSWLRNP